MKTNPILDVDFYKVSHKNMYVDGMTSMYSNLTPRNSKHFTFKSSMFDNKVVVFGIQVMVMNLVSNWNENFFTKPLEPILDEYQDVLKVCLGIPDADTSFWRDLYELGHLPISIKALPEGIRCPIGVPVFTITNTDDRFAWLVNYLETYLSTNIWKPITMATNSYEYKRVIEKFNALTADTTDFIPWQVHDFSARGLGNSQEWSTNSIAHLTSFSGTDTVQAILGARHYYGADLSVGGSVPATEHSVMTIGINAIGGDKLEAEKQYLNKLLTELYPTGIVSVVCDSYDFWGVIEHNLSALKETILTRDGKLVIRPDSGTPIDVICGTDSNVENTKGFPNSFDKWSEWVAESIDSRFSYELDAEEPMYDMTSKYKFNDEIYNVTYTPDLNRYDKTYYYVDNYGSTVSKCKFTKLVQTVESKGLLQSLWDIFGGTINSRCYKVLDLHIGIIYGDAITADVYEAILTRMKSMGFSSDNLVVGVGGYTSQMLTRDTFSFAVKATHCVVDGQSIDVSKEPKTDSSKKSAKGLLSVMWNEVGELELRDQCTPIQEELGCLVEVLRDSKLFNTTTLDEIRQRLN